MELYKLQSSLSHNILHSSLTLSLLGPIFLSTLISNTCSISYFVSESCFWPDCFLPFCSVHNNFIIHYHFQEPQQIHTKIHIKWVLFIQTLKLNFSVHFSGWKYMWHFPLVWQRGVHEVRHAGADCESIPSAIFSCDSRLQPSQCYHIHTSPLWHNSRYLTTWATGHWISHTI